MFYGNLVGHKRDMNEAQHVTRFNCISAFFGYRCA